MLRILLTGAAVALASPVMAQEMQQNAVPSDPAAATSSTQAASPAGADTSATAAAQTSPSATQVSTVVDAEFPVYDADKSGQLEEAEFAKWMLALKNQEMQATGKSVPQEQLAAWASAAFASADADKSSSVSKAELTSYLGG